MTISLSLYLSLIYWQWICIVVDVESFLLFPVFFLLLLISTTSRLVNNITMMKHNGCGFNHSTLYGFMAKIPTPTIPISTHVHLTHHQVAKIAGRREGSVVVGP